MIKCFKKKFPSVIFQKHIDKAVKGGHLDMVKYLFYLPESCMDTE